MTTQSIEENADHYEAVYNALKQGAFDFLKCKLAGVNCLVVYAKTKDDKAAVQLFIQQWESTKKETDL